jgi:hypothetical protein
MRKVRVEPSTPEGRFALEAERLEVEAITPRYVPHPHPDWYAIPPGVLCVVDAFCGEVWTKDKGREWLSVKDDDARLACEP